MKRKLVTLLCAAMTIGMLSGCGIEGNIVISEDGTVTQSSNCYYNEKEYEQWVGSSNSAANYQKVEKNGQIFYLDMSGETSSKTRCVSPTEVYAPFATGEDDNSSLNADTKDLFDFYVETITFPVPIVKTNGTLSEDQKTVTFDLLEMLEQGESAAYAYTAESKGALFLDAEKYIKDNVDSVELVSDSNIVSVKVNGKEVEADTKVAIKKDGKYKIVVDNETVSKTFTVIKDTLAPVIKGVKNGKSYKKPVTIKYSDANKIACATLNGKKIKSGTKVKKKGSYTLNVRDVAGNEKTVFFTVK